ncbi:hypothetical protein COCNU_05G009590 [Cocos nucifera]|uniref:Uncharacterized protein n=1 Tax=Cocos nucifera TaxID=13894 RepID=A0A8K0N1W1_COCNU|nr:hypothetical protein COCNU_05G009590 [Cocos nucifera]
MARPLQAQLPVPSLVSIPNPITFLLLASVAAIASVVISLCTTRKHLKMSKEQKNSTPGPLSREHPKLLSNLSNIGRKAMGMAKMISWKKANEADEQAVWKKSIVMGEKCRQLDFSGQILYDSEGNQLPQLPPRTARGGGAQGVGHTGKV